MSWDTIEAASFEEFVRQLTDVLPTTSAENNAYWFRGQSNSSWNLEPTFLRSSDRLGLCATTAVELETEALKAFRSKAHLFVSPHLLDKVRTTLCWWALMQHHGAPTRLLDWTISPYVAAYFAAQQDVAKQPGAVWCFCSQKLTQVFEEQHGPLPDFAASEAPDWCEHKLEELSGQQIVIPLTFAYASNERIVAQQGRFTMCFKVQQKHDCIINQLGSAYIRKFLIPHDRKPDFLLRLREMNITGSVLFPGIDGLGQSIRELVSLGIHYRKRRAGV
jgi:FRG domain-containing protein